MLSIHKSLGTSALVYQACPEARMDQHEARAGRMTGAGVAGIAGHRLACLGADLIVRCGAAFAHHMRFWGDLEWSNWVFCRLSGFSSVQVHH